MNDGDGLAMTIRDLARGATDARVIVRRLTTHQVATSDSPGLAEGAPGRAVALTTRGEGGTTLRYFMVGKDSLDDEAVVLG